MALRVVFEIGHEASLKTKRTNEIFTHDWEVFVRGVDGADISHYVDKVVFHLHETFPKPKRVIKEPPYSVAESGYAGFILPIEIHLKNREEPKKIRFNYGLDLQQTGPTIVRLQKEKFVFQNPSEEFRRKLLKGGAMVSSAGPFSNVDHDKNGGDTYADDRPAQLIGKPKYAGDGAKKPKPRLEEPPRASNQFMNLFGTPIHKTSTISPDPKKPSPTPKPEKKEKEKSHSDRDRQKVRRDSKERDYRDDRKAPKEDKLKDDKKPKPHRERDLSKEKSLKRPLEKPGSPVPSMKRPTLQVSHSPRRAPSPSNKSNSSASSKEDSKQVKQLEIRAVKMPEITPPKTEKKPRKDKKSHDKDRENKKDRKDREGKTNSSESRDGKLTKDTSNKEVATTKDKPIAIPKTNNKFSILNMLKDPADASKYNELKQKNDHEKKHKHKKKDKKRDESREKNKDHSLKEKKHKHDKQKEKNLDTRETINIPEKLEPPKEIERINTQVKSFKEKERNHYSISPIPPDPNSQSSSKSSTKLSKTNKSMHSSSLSSTSDSDSDRSANSDSEDATFSLDNTKNIRMSNAKNIELARSEPSKSSTTLEAPKNEKLSTDRNPSNNNHKLQKNKEKSVNKDKDVKKDRKRKSGSKGDDSESKLPKLADDTEHAVKGKRSELAKNPSESSRSKESRSKTDTKVQDDGVSSSLSDNPVKCDSPATEEEQIPRQPMEISPDYMVQLQELQQRIMTIKSNEELERVVNLIAETGKYEVTKKTFDFDLCLLDRRTVQQLQEMIGCESRA